jgi:hypothetical protein
LSYESRDFKYIPKVFKKKLIIKILMWNCTYTNLDSLNDYSNRLMFRLNTLPTQSAHCGGKTASLLKWAMSKYLSYKSYSTDQHLLEIIVTNKSLVETKQWKVRTEREFTGHDDVSIEIIASKDANFKNIHKYIGEKIINAKDRSHLPNILIMCFHKKRVCDDIITLLSQFQGIHPTPVPNIQQLTFIKFNISFDEADNHLGLLSKFLKDSSIYQNHAIDSITFTTATPYEKFWKMLQKNGIHELISLHSLSEFQDEGSFEESWEDYMKFSEHNHVYYENDTDNPLIYIMNAMIYVDILRENRRKIIFAPGHEYTEKIGVGSHKEISDYFISMGYCCLIMNGKYKEFRYPPDFETPTETILEFEKKHNLQNCEFREILVKWNALHENINLVITGNNVLERGVTFNTTGFNFTDIILSKYHAKTPEKLVQMKGRGNGGKEYVQRINIISSEEIITDIITRENNMKYICSLNPDTYNQEDFTNSEYIIPVKITINNDELLQEIIILKESGRRGYMRDLKNRLIYGIENNLIELEDNNNRDKFNIYRKDLGSVRMWKEPEAKHNRRYKTFNDRFIKRTSYKQGGDDDKFTLDLVKDEYVHDGYTNPKNVMWICCKRNMN